MFLVSVVVIVNSKLLKRHSKAKRRAPAYSRALRQIRGFSNSPWEAQVRLPEGERMRQIRGVFQRIVRNRNRNRKLLISRAPTKAKSQEPAYSQALNQNKIDRQRSRSRESGRQTVDILSLFKCLTRDMKRSRR